MVKKERQDALGELDLLSDDDGLAPVSPPADFGPSGVVEDLVRLGQETRHVRPAHKVATTVVSSDLQASVRGHGYWWWWW